MAKRDTGWTKWEPVALQNNIDYHTYYRRVIRSNWDQQAAATIPCLEWEERRAMSLKVRRANSKKKVNKGGKIRVNC